MVRAKCGTVIIMVASLVASLVLPLATSAYAQRAGQNDATTAAGLWQAVDEDTHQPSGWFLIRRVNGVYVGIIAKMFLKPGQDPNKVCDRCRGDRRDRPWLGLEIIRGMQRDGSQYTGGTILDPRNGDVYDALMRLSPDGRTLTVRGYLGISLFGQDQYWTRLPNSAWNQLAPSIYSGFTAKPQNSARD